MARDRATAEAPAKAFAQQETQRAEAEKKRTDEQLTRAGWLLHAGTLAQAQGDFEAGNGGLALHDLDDCQVSRRGWERRYLWTRINAKQTPARHTGPVWSVAYSPDGRRVFARDTQNTLQTWSLADGQRIDPVAPPPGPARSPDNFRQALPECETIPVTGRRPSSVAPRSGGHPA